MFRAGRRMSGFTIVELLVVIAVAGLIISLVFLAIPSLERNSRNGLRRQDVSLALQAVSHYELNDTGAFPRQCGGTGQPCITPNDSIGPNDYFLRFDQAKLGYYSGDQVYLQPQDSSTVTDKNPITNLQTVRIYNYEKCDPAGSGKALSQGAGYNDVVAQFAIETLGGASPQCEQL